MLLSSKNGREADASERACSPRECPPQTRVDERSPNGTNGSARHPHTQATFAFRRATKRDARLRLAISGPSGSGKTYTLLRAATELGAPIAMVDTERGSASKYADLFEFDVLELDSYDPCRLIEIIDDAVSKHYRVLCIDSLSHFWMGKDGELEKVDRAARRMQTPNSFAAWKQITPIHNALIDKIISAPIHVLVSMRSKTEWILDRDDRSGKTVPRKVGLAPVMRDGIEYEFDVCGDMDQENTLVITKTRCPQLAGGIFAKPGRELVDVLKHWLGTSTVAAQPPEETVTVANAIPTDREKNSSSPDDAVFVNPELASVWKRMCTPRGVAKEFEELRSTVERLAGSAGIAEYCGILRQHGVNHPKEFRASQPARLCAKDVFRLVAELRASAMDAQGQLLSMTKDRLETQEAFDPTPEVK